jgi:hypothetical protein
VSGLREEGGRKEGRKEKEDKTPSYRIVSIRKVR